MLDADARRWYLKDKLDETFPYHESILLTTEVCEVAMFYMALWKDEEKVLTQEVT